MTAATTTVQAALRREQYELAALRLLLGVLIAIHDTAPAAREEMIALLAREARG